MNRPLPAARLAPLVLITACSTGEPVPVGIGEPTDVALAARYAVDIEVLPPGDGCVIGGLTAEGLDAEARVDQRGRAVTWVQQAPDAVGADWRLAGHICDADEGPVLRLRGGRTAAVTAGDDYCLVDLSLPDRHYRAGRAADRCADADGAVVELTIDACGRLTAEFPLGIRFVGDTCSNLEPCALEMRWIARPIGGPDGGAGCDEPSDGGAAAAVDDGVADAFRGDAAAAVDGGAAAAVDDSAVEDGAADASPPDDAERDATVDARQ